MRYLAFRILIQVASKNAYADELLDATRQQKPLNAADQSLLTELVHGTIRQRRYLDWILAQLFHGNFETCATRLKTVLELSLYQLAFLDRVPAYAAVSEGVALARQLGGAGWGNLVNAVLRAYLRKPKPTVPLERDSASVWALSIKHSHPEWMIKRWLARYGSDNTVQYCEYNNRRPQMSIRVNLARVSREKVIHEFESRDIAAQPSQYFEDFIKLERAQDITRHPYWKQGYLAIQDESTAMPCQLLAPEPGETVVDLCAAPGGKTCHIAHLTNDTGTVVAVDVSKTRLLRLQENKHRLRLTSVVPIVADGRSLPMQSFDRILVDAPCSGLGVLAKRSDLRWRRNLEDVRQIRQVQLQLLNNAARLLKRSGVLVYSVCTLEPEETDEVIREFLQTNPDFMLDVDVQLPKPQQDFRSEDAYWRTLPFAHAMDGSFTVRLIKN